MRKYGFCSSRLTRSWLRTGPRRLSQWSSYPRPFSLIGELKEALAAEPEPMGKEVKKQRRQQKKQMKELEKHRDKLEEYDSRLEQTGQRNSMLKIDPDATFMRMKEDAMNNS